jgi:hypothetical protein
MGRSRLIKHGITMEDCRLQNERQLASIKDVGDGTSLE